MITKTLVQIPEHVITNKYFWYIYRCLYKLEQEQKIVLEVHKNIDPIDWHRYVATIKIDGKAIILDLCDSTCLPIWEIEQAPIGTIILKANAASKLWKNAPETFEHKLPKDQEQYLPLVKPFIFGRSLSLDYDIDERAFYGKYISPISKEIVSLSGEGRYEQQTSNRLKLYDFISSSFILSKYELLWNHREHFNESEKIVNYNYRIRNYHRPAKDMFNCYQNYIQWLSTGKYSLNMPGISASQPFRIVDAILAQRHIISTKIWIDAYEDCPKINLPIEGYFHLAEDNETQARYVLANLDSLKYSLDQANKWYEKYLSVAGMWQQLLKGVS